MTKTPSKSSRYYIDAHAISGFLSAADFDLAQETPRVETFSDAGPRVVVGNYGYKHALRSLWDGSDSQIDAIAQGLMGSTSDHYLAEAFAGTTIGTPVLESIVQLAGKPIKASVGAAVLMDLPLEGAGGASRSLILQNVTLATTSTGTSIDQAAPSSDGATYQATFRFLSGTFTNCTLQIQDSSNGTTWGDTTGLTATSTGNYKVVRTSTTAIVRQYVSVLATTLSIGGSAEVLATGGVVAGTTPRAT